MKREKQVWRYEELEKYVISLMKKGKPVRCPICGYQIVDWQYHPTVFTNKLADHLLEAHGIEVIV